MAEGTEQRNLTGFTLFQVKAGWQMSCRSKDETGWIVKIISDEQAQLILSMLDNEALLLKPANNQVWENSPVELVEVVEEVVEDISSKASSPGFFF